MKIGFPGAILGLLLAYVLIHRYAGEGGASAQQAKLPQEDLEKLRAEIKRLHDVAPDQAHAMMSAAYHFNNLWFAAKADNWPLAEFYWNETRSHLRWAVRAIPVRKTSAKQDVDLRAILEALENSPLKQLQEAIKLKDHDKLESAYKFTIEGCYACHKASEKPYLRPRIPDRQAEPTINFDPNAGWPR